MDHIRYDLLTQQALRGVVRGVLTEAAKKGLPGEHHFYIAFDTRAEGVQIPDRLRAQYPEEMTIILQHQFWDMKVSEEAFEVGLSFGGIPSKLVVPFEAVKGFFDPSVQFGLQFEEVGNEGPQATPANAQDRQPDRQPDKSPEKPMSKPAEKTKRPPGLPAEPPAAAVPASVPELPPESPPAAGGAEVVRLDRFRKK
jgi:hypothetical protein